MYGSRAGDCQRADDEPHHKDKAPSPKGYDDADGGGDFSLIIGTPVPPGTYYINVTEYNNDETIPAYT